MRRISTPRSVRTQSAGRADRRERRGAAALLTRYAGFAPARNLFQTTGIEGLRIASTACGYSSRMMRRSRCGPACFTAAALSLTVACSEPVWSQERAPDSSTEPSARAMLLSAKDCAPEYPRESLAAEQTGLVRVRIHVTASGELRGVSLIQSSGFARLDNATVDALSRCKFAPATRAGKAIDSSFTLEYNWNLEGPPPGGAESCRPEYPVEAVRAEEQGKTRLRFQMDAAGRAQHIEIDQSSGSARLDEAAMASLRRCQFKPRAAQGVSTTAQTFTVEFVWRLQDGEPATPLGPELPDPYRARM